MTLSRFSNYLSFAAILAGHFITGISISAVGPTFKNHFDEILNGRPLPTLTEFILPYATSSAPIYVGLVLGVGLALPLYFIERSSKREYLPFLVTMAWILCVFQLATIFIAMTLPLLSLNVELKP